MKTKLLLLSLAIGIMSCEDPSEECAECNDQIADFIAGFNTETCGNNPVELTNKCENTPAREAKGIITETCLEGEVQNPGDCETLGRRNTPFHIEVDGPTPDSMRLEIEHNGVDVIRYLGSNQVEDIIFETKVFSGLPMRLRLYRHAALSDSLMATELPKLIFARDAENIDDPREIRITYSIDDGYGMNFPNWD